MRWESFSQIQQYTRQIISAPAFGRWHPRRHLTQSSRWPVPDFLYKRNARKQVDSFTSRGVEEDRGNYNIWHAPARTDAGAFVFLSSRVVLYKFR